MNSTISKEQIAQYQKDGFIIIEDFLNPEEVAHWSKTIDKAVRDRKGTKFPHSDVKTGDDDWINKEADFFGKVFDQIINLWQTDENVKKLILDPKIGKMATLLSESEGIRAWHDQSLIKQPWGNATAWHIDTPFWSFTHREALSIWIALEDVTIENGCLWFMPGSHRDTEFGEPGISVSMGDIFNKYPKYHDKTPIPSVIKAGSCSFHNGMCLHAAGGNMTPGTRRAMTCAFMPDGSTFNGNQNVLSDEKFAKLTIGDLMDDESQNPLIYHTKWEQ